MPYSESGAGVPARIKGAKRRRQWAHVFNTEYAAHGDEGRAIAAANSVYNQSKKTDIPAFIKTDPDALFVDTGEYDEDKENDIREEITIWGDYAEDGPTFDPDGKYLCATCGMRSGEDGCTTVVSPISFDTGSCRIYMRGDAEEHEVIPQKLTQIEAAYTERPNVKGFGCSRCMYGGEAKEVDSDGRKGWCTFWGCHVEPLACCFKNQGDDDVFAPLGEAKEDKSSKATKGLEMDEFKKFIQLVKVDEQTHTTWGIATSEVPDKDNEVCVYDEAKKAYTKWSEDYIAKTSAAGQDVSMGNVRIMHGLEIGGKVIKLEFKDKEKQVWLGTQPADDRVWKLIKGGYIVGLSQGGKYLWKDKRGDLTYYAPEISEVSYVDAPCNPDATFAYVKADGSMELMKFAKGIPDDPELSKLLKGEIPAEAGAVPSSPTPIHDGVSTELFDNKSYEDSVQAKAACACDCTDCKGGNCAGCSAGEKCAACKTAKAVKYLVRDKQGKGHLPYTDSAGKVNRRLLGAAWAALFSNHRGNPYSGPGIAGAKKKIKQIYASNGWDPPSEKAAAVVGLIKTLLDDAIQSRFYGLKKGMWNLSSFAQIIEQLAFLCMAIEDEAVREGGDEVDFGVSDSISSALNSLLDSLLTYTEDQVSELREHVE